MLAKSDAIYILVPYGDIFVPEVPEICLTYEL